MTLTRDKLVERIARAMWERIEIIGGKGWTWDGQPAAMRETWLGHASNALAAIESASLCIVPREPTEGMIRATEGTNSGVVNLDQWRAMIAAAGEG